MNAWYFGNILPLIDERNKPWTWTRRTKSMTLDTVDRLHFLYFYVMLNKNNIKQI